MKNLGKYLVFCPATRLLAGLAILLNGCVTVSKEQVPVSFEPTARQHLVRESYPESHVGSSIKVSTYPELVIPQDPLTEKFVKEFSTSYRGFIKAGLSRRAKYAPTINAVFNRYGLPLALLNIAFVESQFSPTARSKSGAVGIWQFMPRTARAYGLTIDGHGDQRVNVLLSTIAAANYLRDLFDSLEDWNLVLAAYHAGKGAILAAEKAGGTNDYRLLVQRGKIPKCTQEFVARVLAITKISTNFPQYGFRELNPNEG